MKPVHWIGSSREDLKDFRGALGKSRGGLPAMAKGKRSVTGQAAAGIPVTRGSGNVFADLGFRDAEELQLKAALTRQIANRIKEFELTQVQAGRRLGISQPDVSKLMHGRYTGYTVDRLIAILNALEVDIEIVIRPRSLKASRCRGSVRILEAAS
jgi:predicted XRE-type DNA-binding protein